MKQDTRRPLSDLPNLPGYVCELVRADGVRQVARVAVAADGCHYCATPSGSRVSLAPFVGWMPYAKPEAFAIPGYVAKGAPHLWTRDQLDRSLSQWQIDAKPPRKGDALLLTFPAFELCAARITVHPNKGADGKTLFACQFYARAI